MAQDDKRKDHSKDKIAASGADSPQPPSLSARLAAASTDSDSKTKTQKKSDKPNSTPKTSRAAKPEDQPATKSDDAKRKETGKKTVVPPALPKAEKPDPATSAIAKGKLPPPIPATGTLIKSQQGSKAKSASPPPPISLTKPNGKTGTKPETASRKFGAVPPPRDNLARKEHHLALPEPAKQPLSKPAEAAKTEPAEDTAEASISGALGKPLAEQQNADQASTTLASQQPAAPEISEQPEPVQSAEDDEAGDTANRRSRREARRRPAGPVRERLAANDDAPSIGGLIYALQQRPSAKPFHYATVASVVWGILGAIALWFVFSAKPDMSLTALLEQPITFLMITAIAMPILVMWFLALLAWRSEELRLRSSTMAEVAIRLAEPDRLAEQSAASLGQAVRRQVSFMNDAVTRALGRAGELEALVHNEVSALERSYEENERKIRGLIEELSGERTALLRTSDDVHTTLKSLGTEVPTLIEKLSTQQFKLAQIIEGAGDNLTMLETSLTQGARKLESSIGGQAEKLQTVLDGHAGRIESTMQNYTGDVDSSLQSRTEQLQTVLDSYTVAVDGALHARTEQMHTMLSDHTKSLGTTLTDTTRQLDNTLDTHGTAMRAMLDDHSDRMGKAMGDTSGQMQGMLENYTGALAQALASRTDEMQQAFQGYMVTLDNSISNRTANLQSVFEEYARALDTTLASRAHALDSQLVERTRALDDAFNDRLRLFDQTIIRTTAAIDEAVGEKAVALTTALDSHAQNFRDTITRQTADIDDTLTHGISAVRRSSENVTRQSLKAIEGLASQSDLLKRVSENLLGQINSVTNRFENQGQLIMQAANALESANYKIDSALKQRHGELSGTLDRLSNKADEFSQFIEGYSSTIETQLSEAENRAKAAAEELREGAFSHKREAIADLERLRAEAGEESQRALSDLRQRFSTVSQEVTSQLGNLSDRFDETTEEVRQRTHKATQAIEEEQARLQQKLQTIPANTRESAEAMRRALQDQLTALEQLSQMTSKQARDRDVSAPIQPLDKSTKPERVDPASLTARYDREAHSERAETQRQLSSLSSSLARELHARPLRPAGASASPGPAPQQTSSKKPEIKPADQNQAQTPRLGQDENAPDGQAPRGTAPRSGQQQPQGEGWSLGDLLKRASLEEESSTPAKAPAETPAPKQASATGTLPDISVMVQAIDPSTAQEIWNRLHTGQRGIMVPSIYPPPARAAFEELSRRYRIEPQLRDAIGKFLADFERTIRAAEQKDPSGRLVQNHLLSEMGRAYLFLAHVSGRLDGRPQAQ